MNATLIAMLVSTPTVALIHTVSMRLLKNKRTRNPEYKWPPAVKLLAVFMVLGLQIVVWIYLHVLVFLLCGEFAPPPAFDDHIPRIWYFFYELLPGRA